MLRKLNIDVHALSHRFLGIPVRSAWFSHPLVPEVYCVDSEISVTASGCNQSFFGHAASTSLSEALNRSCCELVERMLATRPFIAPELLISGLPVFRVFGRKMLRRLEPEAVLIRESQDSCSNALSASGLGFGTALGPAIRHGAFELLERHILAKMWYTDQEPLIHLLDETLAMGFIIEYFTTPDAIPFVFAVARNADRDVFYCGSAIRRSVRAAITHARMEVLQLLTNLLVKEVSVAAGKDKLLRGNVKSTIDRMQLLQGPSAFAMHDWFRGRVCKIEPTAKTLRSLRGILTARFPVESVTFVSLGEWEKGRAVRVLIPEALTKNEARSRYSYLDPVPDPFC